MGRRVPGATGADGTEAFARLLRELKDRSGLSYGTLAKRLHMSTSTLHRYCNGTAVPVEYAPVERLARVCRATPDELVELHRRWILADATRGSRVEPVAADPVAVKPVPVKPATANPVPADTVPADTVTVDPDPAASDEPVVVDMPRPTPPASRRRRTALIVAVASAAVLGGVALAVPLSGKNGSGGDRAAGDTAPLTGTTHTSGPSLSPSPSPTGQKPSASPSASATESRSAGKNGGGQDGGQGADGGGASTAVPLTVGTRPYVYDQPCSQHFLVDSEPAQVGPPASEQDAPRWAAAYGAVSSGGQEVALTVQGTGSETVVLEALHVRILSRDTPLAWNDYAMGVGCGGGVETKSFDIDLDKGSPTVTVQGGQRDFPYKVSESDPEVFYVTAHTKANDIRWDLSLDWSSGSRHGTVHIDNSGTAFRTSADVNRPGYDYPLGGSEWIERES